MSKGGVNLSSPAEIGQRLRQARERLGYSLVQVSKETQIEIKYLHAIERGQLHLLPNMIYARAYVKKYAELMGEKIRFSQMSQRQQQRKETTQTQTRQTYRRGPIRQKHIRPRSDLLDEEDYRPTFSTQPFRKVVSNTTSQRRVINPSYVDEEPEEEKHKAEEVEEEAVEEIEEEEEEVAKFPSRRVAHAKDKDEAGWTRWYTRVLIVAAVLLVLATVYFIYEKTSSPPGLPVSQAISTWLNKGTIV
jgi:hypothetical protein